MAEKIIYRLSYLFAKRVFFVKIGVLIKGQVIVF